eukprot:scaffold44480_cov17-Tisochrysis_lutea.AAC.1
MKWDAKQGVRDFCMRRQNSNNKRCFLAGALMHNHEHTFIHKELPSVLKKGDAVLILHPASSVVKKGTGKGFYRGMGWRLVWTTLLLCLPRSMHVCSMQAMKTLPNSNKEQRIPRAEAPTYPPHRGAGCTRNGQKSLRKPGPVPCIKGRFPN